MGRSRPTVKAAVLDLLCQVTHYEDAGLPSGPGNVHSWAEVGGFSPAEQKKFRSVGLPYGDIWSRIKKQFPKHTWVTRNSIQWYVTKIRRGDESFEDYVLPQRRPRTDWSGKDDS